jgi:uncharacterized membrane protein YfcA
LVLRLPQHQAQGLSLAVLLLPNGLPAILQYRKAGIRLPWRIAGLVILAFLPGVALGALVANRIPDGPMKWIFAGLLVLLAARTFLQSGQDVRGHGEAPAILWMRALVIGLVGGLFSGLLGIGGGLVMIPMMGFLLRMSQHEAQLLSLAVMLPPVGLPGLWVYLQHQSSFPWLILVGLALGFLLGTYLGARLATRLAAPMLRKGFALLMVLMAILMLVRA